MSSSSTATLPLPAATPHLRAVRSVPSNGERWHGGPVPPRAAGAQSVPSAAAVPPSVPHPSYGSDVPQLGQVPVPPQALLAALPEGAAVVAALPHGTLPQALLAQYGAQFGAAAGHPMVGYLVLVPAENASVAGAVPGAVPGAGVPAPAAPTASPVAGVAPAGAASAAVRPVRPAGRGIAVDVERRNAYVDGRLLDLTYLEFELLAHLTEHPQRVHTRDHLVSAVWGYGHVGDGRTVDVHVARLRRKLGVAYRDSIVTVRRVGYKYTPVA
ncbi:winged helix-turn-helix domain-containing protein [Streptomyces sp. BE20]|uniref:winged helix-turn-helix domain-containing protein n=1 Tax=Streptomyces sp. BE20 TaxID=3002525 RepID=UPI002E791546|nr:winged helix-turn-helix domain-containing protein [Streptomyces sp. BE20]MEE1824566.1 winged helix-turn-helix domain-containing protein [Streptomyces sp. BE20]